MLGTLRRVASPAGSWLAHFVWAVALLGGLTLVLSGWGILNLIHRVGGAAPGSALALVVRADVAFGWQLIAVGVVLCAYGAVLCAYTLRFLPPAVRGFFHASTSGYVAFWWSVSGLVWLILYVILASLLGVAGDQRIVIVSIVAPLVVVGTCFAQSTALGVDGHASLAGYRPLARMLGIGFLLIAAADLFSFEEINRAVRQVSQAFGEKDVQLALSSVHLSTDYWLDTPTGNSLLTPLLKVSPLLIFAYAYLLTVTTPDDLPAFFRRCPRFPPSLLARRDVVYAMAPMIVGILPIVAGTIVGNASASGSEATHFFTIAPFYVVFVVVDLAWAWKIGSARWGAVVVGTNQRDELLRAERFVQWLIYFAAGLTGGSLLLWGLAEGWPLAKGWVDLVVMLVPRAASEPTLWGFAVIAFLCIVLNYGLLVELPYWLGQRRWKAAELTRAEQRLQDAKAALEARLTDPTDPIGSVTNPVPTTERLLVHYVLAQADKQDTEDAPIFKVQTVFDILKLVVGSVLTTLVDVGLGFEDPNAPKQLQSVLDDIVRLLVGG
jgi:hypothetical protein